MQNEQEFAATSNEVETNEIDWKAEAEKLKATNERLLHESTKYKTRKNELDEYRQQLEAYKKKELEQKGNYQEMLRMEQEKRLELENELKQRDQRLMKSNIFNAVANYAKDAYDVNDLLAQRDYAKMIEIDEETLEPTSQSIQSFVDSLKNDKKYLFKGNKIAAMADTKPAIDKPREKQLNQMTKDELADFMRNSLGQLPTR